MANTTKNIKTAPVTKTTLTKESPVKEAPVAQVAPENNAKVLTVTVLNDKSQPAPGLSVSIEPSNATLVTNSAGEVQFTLGQATKYSITASYGSSTVTVPYYVTKDGATKMVVNPTYVRKVEKQIKQDAILKSPVTYLSIGVGIFVIFLVFWKVLPFFRRRKKNK